MRDINMQFSFCNMPGNFLSQNKHTSRVIFIFFETNTSVAISPGLRYYSDYPSQKIFIHINTTILDNNNKKTGNLTAKLCCCCRYTSGAGIVPQNSCTEYPMFTHAGASFTQAYNCYVLMDAGRRNTTGPN